MKSKWDSSSEDDSDNVAESKKQEAKVVTSVAGTKRALRENDQPDSKLPKHTKKSETAVDKIQQVQNDFRKPDDKALECVDMSEASKCDSLLADEHEEIRPAKREYNPVFDGCRSVDNYEQVNFIDQGTYGMVFKARCRQTGELYALKQIKFGPETSKIGFPISALREINILLSLQHPNIVRVKEMVVGSSIDKIYMVMEYCENDLKTCMKMSRQSFSTAEIKQLMLQLLSAIEHMHYHWYIHRDLKTSNLLYSNDGMLRVCDFGMARKYGSPIAPYTHEVVTLWYRAPEVLLGARTYSTPLDMWSVGCIFAEMLTGDPIFPGQGEADQILKIFRVLGAPNDEKWPGFSSLPHASKISWRVPSRSKLRELFPVASFSGGISLSDEGLSLLNALLHMNPNKRISASDALKHSWLTKEMPKPMPVSLMPKFKSRSEPSES